MLSCHDLSKSFGGLVATRSVTLVVPRGERHGIIGPNGAGKTTLFNLLGGEVLPDRGRIDLAGEDVTRLRPDARARRGLARSFQRNSSFAALTVRQNLACAALLARGQRAWRWMGGREAAHHQAATIADRVGCTALLDRRVDTLSYGTQRQLELGLALAGNPAVLLLDEPTAGMSAEETGRMQTLIGSLPRTLTMLIVEHDMDVVFGLADRITVLDRGAVLATGTPDDIRGSALVRARYLGEAA